MGETIKKLMSDERTERERVIVLIALIFGSFALGMLLAPSRRIIIGSYNGCGHCSRGKRRLKGKEKPAGAEPGNRPLKAKK